MLSARHTAPDGGEDLINHRDIPDAAGIVTRYGRHAAGYDATAQRTMWIRELAVAKLMLRPGDRVLDVACGTGLSLDRLRAAVGADGEVFGIDISPDMLRLARKRVSEAGWRNVRLLESTLESADIPAPLDAVLFHFAHDVMRSPAALRRIFAALRPNARLAFAGMKYAPWWMAPVNLIVRAKARPYMMNLDGLAAPWDMALPYLQEFAWDPVMFGTAYIGWGRAGATAPDAADSRRR